MPTFIDNPSTSAAASLSLAHLLNVPGSTDQSIPLTRDTIHCSTGNATVSTIANTTEFWFPEGYCGLSNTTEANQQLVYRTAGTISNLYLRLTVNSISGGASSFVLRKNTADSGSSISIPASATGEFEDTTNTVSLTAGDLLCYQTIPGAATGTMTMAIMSFMFRGTTETSSRFAAANAAGVAVGNTQRFFPLNGNSGSVTQTEANCSITQQQTTGSYKNLAVKLSANLDTGSATCVLRKNTAASALTISIAAGLTGVFEDTANSVSVTTADVVCYALVSGSANNITMMYIAADYNNTTNNVSQFVNSATAPASMTTTTTFWQFLNGQLANNTTEAQSQLKVRQSFTMANMTVNVGTNNRDGTTTLTLRLNGANTTQTISITAAATGVFTDSTHTDLIAAVNDKVNYQTTTAGTTGTYTPRSIVMWATRPAMPAGGANIVKAITETAIAVSESLVRLAAKTRTKTETIGPISESPARLAAKTRTVAQTVGPISESVLRIKGIVRPLSQTIVISESLARLAAKIRSKTETITVSESVTRLAAKTRTLSQSITVSESVVRVKGKVKTLAETVTIGAGSIVRLVSEVRTLAQTVVISESLARLAAKSRPLSQTVTISESVARLVARSVSKALSETVTIGSGSVVRLAGKIRTKTETITISESPVRLAAKIRTISQTITVSDSITRVKGIVRTLSQTVGPISESIVRMTAKIRTLTQTVTISESLLRVKGVIRTLAQTIAISDAVSRTVTIFGGGNAVTRALSQTVAISESLNRMAAKIRSKTETVGPISENLVKSRGRVKAVPTQTVGPISDAIARRIQKVRTLLSIVNITEALQAFKNGILLVPIPASNRGGFTTPYRKPVIPRLKQILYPVYSPGEMQRIERRRKLRRYEPLIVIPAFKYNINQVVAPFIINDPVKNKVYVRFAVSGIRGNDNHVVFSGKAIPITIRPLQDKVRINKAKAEFTMSQKGIERSVQLQAKTLNRLSKVLRLWFMAKELFGY